MTITQPPHTPPDPLPWGRLLLAVLGTMLLTFIVCSMLGCAAGKSPTGEIVLGFGVGKIVETGNEWLANKGTGGQLAALLLGAAGGIPIVGTIATLFGKKIIAAKTETAKLEGANEGWEAREKAAAVQAPLGGVA